jgi:hypothetical protein
VPGVPEHLVKRVAQGLDRIDLARRRWKKGRIRATVAKMILDRAPGIPSRSGGRTLRLHDLRHNAESRIIPSTPSARMESRGIPREGVRVTRHNQRPFRKARMRSPGSYRRDRRLVGTVFANACLFSIGSTVQVNGCGLDGFISEK